MANTTVVSVTVDGMGAVPVTVTERGEGRPFLLLHGGAGPQSVDGFADLLATQEPARVIVPTHPGSAGRHARRGWTVSGCWAACTPGCSTSSG